MTPAELSSMILAAVRDAVGAGELAGPVPGMVPTRTTQDGEQASTVALRLAAFEKRLPAEVAALLAGRIAGRPGIERVRVTGPGVLTVAVPATLPQPIDEGYGQADVPLGGWPVSPRTFGNPGFRVRFAYARAASAGRHAREIGLCAGPGAFADPRERRVAGLVAEFPDRARRAERDGDARPLTRHLEWIADAYHDVYEQCPALPKGDEPITSHHSVRLSLAEAVRTVVGNGLRMLGEIPRERI